jgi:hypothetical protein
MPEWAEIIGAFLRWLVKGCKTKLKEEWTEYLMNSTP